MNHASLPREGGEQPIDGVLQNGGMFAGVDPRVTNLQVSLHVSLFAMVRLTTRQ